MSSCKALLLSLLLVTLVYSQVAFNNTCANNSLIPLLATGSINLNPLDTYNNGANKDYTKDLSIAKFQPVDVLGYAFALSGFQTACGQSFYALVIDKVTFENQNTRMRIVVNFRNTNDGTITKWSLVTFTYIVVSRNLNGAYSNIWATVAETTVFGAGAIDLLGPAFVAGAGADCSIYTDPSVNNGGCAAGTPIAGTTGGSLIIHSYIMGFQWNSNKSSTNFLAASVFEANSVPAGSPITSENTWIIDYAAAPLATGPQVIINNFGGALEYIKIGFVYSRFDDAISDPITGTYPYGSSLLYTSSYIFDKVVKFNTTIPVKKGLLGSASEYNQHYYRLPDTRYAIYGLTAFSLPKSTTTVCGSQIWVNATLTSINTYNMFTPNLSPTNFYFSADIFTLNLDVLCASLDPNVPTFSDVLIVGKKNYFTVPTQSLEQYIVEDPINFADPLGSNLANVFRPAALPNTIFLQYYSAKNGNNDTILYRAEIPFTGLTVGAPIKFEFGYFDTRNPAQDPT